MLSKEKLGLVMQKSTLGKEEKQTRPESARGNQDVLKKRLETS